MSRARARLMLSAALAALVVLAAMPATAGTAEKSELTDQAGDANFINSQGLGAIIGDESLVTPVDLSSADLRAMWLETIFEEDETIEEDGSESVIRTATGLRWNVRTTAPASPSFGPTVLFRMPLTIGGCTAFLESQVRGPASSPADVQRGSLRVLGADCPGGVRSITSPAFAPVFDDDVMTVEFPFAEVQGLLGAKTTLASNGAGHVRTVLVAATAPAIDEAPGDWSFRLSSDLPQ